MLDTKKDLILTDKELTKGANSLILKSNSSFIPTLLGTIGGVVAFGLEQMMIAMAFGSLFFIGILVFLVNILFRKENFKKLYLKAQNLKIEAEQAMKIKNLKKTLESEESKTQIEAFERKYDLFKDTLKGQLSESSYTYQRLLGAFDQVYLFGLSKIEKVLSYENNKRSIDEFNIRKELGKLEQKHPDSLKPHEVEKIEALKSRLAMRGDYDEKIELILADNEKALTKMDELQGSLTDLHKEENMRIALNELSTLATALNFEESHHVDLSS